LFAKENGTRLDSISKLAFFSFPIFYLFIFLISGLANQKPGQKIVVLIFNEIRDVKVFFEFKFGKLFQKWD